MAKSGSLRAIAVARQGADHFTASPRHEGVASPEDWDFAKTKRLWRRLAQALAARMKARIEMRSLESGRAICAAHSN
jgi:two-component sensor histidine kinase